MTMRGPQLLRTIIGSKQSAIFYGEDVCIDTLVLRLSQVARAELRVADLRVIRPGEDLEGLRRHLLASMKTNAEHPTPVLVAQTPDDRASSLIFEALHGTLEDRRPRRGRPPVAPQLLVVQPAAAPTAALRALIAMHVPASRFGATKTVTEASHGGQR